MVVGLGLMISSWAVVLLTVIGVIPPSLILNLGAYMASVFGLLVGMFGALQFARGPRRSRGSGAVDREEDGSGRK